MEKPKALPIMALFLLLGIIMPVIYYTSGRVMRDRAQDFKENGYPVTCYIKQSSRFLDLSNVTAYYFISSNQTVDVHTVLNKPVKNGDTFEAYIMPGHPYTVFSPEYSMPKGLFFGPVFLASIIGWLLAILYLYYVMNYNILLENGSDIDAELMSCERYDPNTLFGSFRFVDEAGRAHSVKLYIPRNIADVYETYQIRWYEKPNGEIKAATADNRLNKQ